MDENYLTIKEAKALKEGYFKTVVVLKKKTIRSTSKCPEFLSVDLGDATGTLTITVFGSKQLELFRDKEAGSYLFVDAKVGFYNEKFSPSIEDVKPVPATEVAKYEPRLVACSPENFDVMREELTTTIAEIPHEGLRAVTQAVIDDLGDFFYNSPAAMYMHQAYRHGLLEHSLHLARVAKALLPLYPEIDRSLAIAGALLHDVGKVYEYTQTEPTKKTRVGILQGHVVLGYRIVRKQCIKHKLPEDLQERLEHIILSHQGKLEWGAAVMASTPEAIFISQIDNFDAKMAMISSALNAAVEGTEFSDPIKGLEGVSLLLSPAATKNEAREDTLL
ncbi:MAG: HD domain-containing protein [Opitutales bacterium]|nr:HD domain-containing protein [Opitutales bacterium]